MKRQRAERGGRRAETLAAWWLRLKGWRILAIRARTPVGLEQEIYALLVAYQALRIAINDEFPALEYFLRVLPTCLKPGGRVAILTFHSGEDRRVKKSFKDHQQSGLYSEISEEAIRPSREEIHSNPRAASAKLRWARRA